MFSLSLKQLLVSKPIIAHPYGLERYYILAVLIIWFRIDGGPPVSVVYPTPYHARPSDAAMVPQLSQQFPARLTSSQQAELELARKRAQKAAEGKRANATAARYGHS